MSGRDDAEANRRHLEALVGGCTRWREHIEQQGVLGIQWDQLPLGFRQQWWQATDHGQRQPSPEFAARMPELLAVEQAKLASDKREIAATTARERELLSKALPPPCELCLRPHSPCRERCLRTMLRGVRAGVLLLALTDSKPEESK